MVGLICICSLFPLRGCRWERYTRAGAKVAYCMEARRAAGERYLISERKELFSPACDSRLNVFKSTTLSTFLVKFNVNRNTPKNKQAQGYRSSLSNTRTKHATRAWQHVPNIATFKNVYSRSFGIALVYACSRDYLRICMPRFRAYTEHELTNFLFREELQQLRQPFKSQTNKRKNTFVR